MLKVLVNYPKLGPRYFCPKDLMGLELVIMICQVLGHDYEIIRERGTPVAEV